jgi:hypothetical protein
MVKIDGISIEDEFSRSYLPQEVDIFISSIGWEERCPIGWNFVESSGINVKKKIIFFYEEVINKREPFGDMDVRKNNITHFNSIFNLSDNDKQLFVDMLDESTGLDSFSSFIDTKYHEVNDLTIILDFSVMVKPYFFILLKFLSDQKKIKKIFLLYTEPMTYVIKKINYNQLDEAYFTRGSYTPPRDMLSFSGYQDGRKNDALIVLLGFEGQRAKEVTSEINPEVTIPLNGFPSYRPEFKDISLLLNDEILKEKQTAKNLRYAPANNPFETKHVLTQIHKERKKHYNISLAPLGPKPMALGCCLFVLENPECRVIYPYPLEYNSKSSQGYEKTWLYIIEFDYDN